MEHSKRRAHVSEARTVSRDEPRNPLLPGCPQVACRFSLACQLGTLLTLAVTLCFVPSLVHLLASTSTFSRLHSDSGGSPSLCASRLLSSRSLVRALARLSHPPHCSSEANQLLCAPFHCLSTMSFTPDANNQPTSGLAPTSAFDSLSSSLLLSLPPLTSQLNPHAAPVFFPSAISPASVNLSLSAAPPLLPYASQQSTVYFPNTSPPLPVSVGPAPLYYPTQPLTLQPSLRAEWNTPPFHFSSGANNGGSGPLRGTGSGLPSLPYSGYPAFEHRSTGREASSGGGSSRQMSAGRQRWDSGSRWKAIPHTTNRQQSQQSFTQPHQPVQQHERGGAQISVADDPSASNMVRAEGVTFGAQDAAGASPALSGVGRLFETQTAKVMERGLPRPEAIETALDERRDRKVCFPITC